MLSSENENNLDNFMTQANQILKVRKEILERNREMKKLNDQIKELKMNIKKGRKDFELLGKEQDSPKSRKLFCGVIARQNEKRGSIFDQR